LEVLIPKGDDVASGEWAGRLWWTVALGMPVVFLAMAPMFGLSVMTAAAVGCAEFLLSIPVVFWWGADVWAKGSVLACVQNSQELSALRCLRFARCRNRPARITAVDKGTGVHR